MGRHSAKYEGITCKQGDTSSLIKNYIYKLEMFGGSCKMDFGNQEVHSQKRGREIGS